MSARVSLRRHRSGARVAHIEVPTYAGALRVTGVGDFWSDALGAAVKVAARITDDPVIAAIMPPQATIAIEAIRKIAAASAKGPDALKAKLDEFNGPGKTRLLKVLHTEAEDANRPAPTLNGLSVGDAKDRHDQRTGQKGKKGGWKDTPNRGTKTLPHGGNASRDPDKVDALRQQRQDDADDAADEAAAQRDEDRQARRDALDQARQDRYDKAHPDEGGGYYNYSDEHGRASADDGDGDQAQADMAERWNAARDAASHLDDGGEA